MVFDDGRPRRVLRDIDDVVVHQRCRVDHFHHRRHAHGAVAHSAHQLRGQQHQDGPQPLAAAVLQITGNGGDRIDAGHRLQADLALHPLEILLDQIEDLPRG